MKSRYTLKIWKKKMQNTKESLTKMIPRWKNHAIQIVFAHFALRNTLKTKNKWLLVHVDIHQFAFNVSAMKGATKHVQFVILQSGFEMYFVL